MTIWIDADGVPVRARNIVEKAACRTGTPLVLVSDRPLPTEPDEIVSVVEVPRGKDSSDEYILARVEKGDLVVTRDVLLAEGLVENGALVLDERGGVYTEENIRERVSSRERMMEFRRLGLSPESSDSKNGKIGEKEVKAFAAAFDRELTRLLKRL